MPSLSGKRSPWLAGALLLLLAAALTAPAAYALGVRRWSAYVGLLAIALLLFGSLERLWQRRPSLPSRRRTIERSRFRLVAGGKSKGKGNGHARDVPGAAEDDDGDKPRWVM